MAIPIVAACGDSAGAGSTTASNTTAGSQTSGGTVGASTTSSASSGKTSTGGCVDDDLDACSVDGCEGHKQCIDGDWGPCECPQATSTSASTTEPWTDTETGTTGEPLRCPVFPPMQSCEFSCGNGQIDLCFESLSEACDGDALDGESCESLGFKGGALACLETCELDTRACVRCEGPGGALVSCGDAPVEATRPWSLDIASSGPTLGMAWVAVTDDDTATLGFARFASNLDLLLEPVALPAECPEAVQLVAMNDSWLLAVESGAGVELIALDDAGEVLASEVLTATGVAPRLAPGPDGALVVWGEGDGEAWAAIVDDTATAITAPALLPFGEELDSYDYDLSAAYVGDGYLVAARVFLDGVQLARVEPDGAAALTTTTPVPEDTEYPRLVAQGGDVRLTYTDFSGGIGSSGPRWIRLDSAGEAASPIVELGYTPDYFGSTPHVIRGGETVALLPGHSGITYAATALDLYQLDAQGQELDVPQRVVTDPMLLREARAAALGDSIVVAWINGSPPIIGYALLQP